MSIPKSKKVIEIFKSNDHLCEIYSTPEMTFSFVSSPKDGNKQCHLPARCRDYLQDAIRTTLTGATSNIYGFNFDKAKNPPISLLNTRLLINLPDRVEKPDEVIQRGWDLVNYYEDTLGLKRTLVYTTNAGYYVVGPKFWLTSPVLISLYTLLFRVGEFEFKVESYDDSTITAAFEGLINSPATKSKKAINYLESIYKSIRTVLTYHTDIMQCDKRGFAAVYFKDIAINTFHNGTGIVSLCKGANLYKEETARLHKYSSEEDDISKLLIIKDNKISENIDHLAYVQKEFKTAFVENNTIVTEFADCREVVVAEVMRTFKQEELQKKDLKVIIAVGGVKSTHKATMLNVKQALFSAKRFINYIEAEYGIKKTAISTVKIVSKGGQSYFGWLLSVDKAWLSHPVMLTLYIMLVRAAYNYYYSVKDSEKDVAKLIQALVNTSSVYSFHFSYDRKTLKKYVNDIHRILKNREVLFTKDFSGYYFGVTKSQIESLNFKKDFGINSLLSGKHKDKQLQQLYLETTSS